MPIILFTTPLISLLLPYILPFICFLLGTHNSIWLRLLIVAWSIPLSYYALGASWDVPHIAHMLLIQALATYFWPFVAYKIMKSESGRSLAFHLFYGVYIIYAIFASGIVSVHIIHRLIPAA